MRIVFLLREAAGIVSRLVALLFVSVGLHRGYAQEADQLASLWKELETAPAWAAMSRTEVGSKGAKLIEVIRKFSKVKESDVREFVERFVSVHSDSKVAGARVDAWSKIYVLNRFYFAVPPEEKESEIKIFGGWSGMPRKGDLVSILWPLEMEPGGDLRLTGWMGGYFGPNYRALEEFDFFSKKYGRRRLRQ